MHRTAIAAGIAALSTLITTLAAAAATPAALVAPDAVRFSTATPIKHVVVIFQENVSFDHYFGTYPTASNPAGEPRFVPARGTPVVNGLSSSLLITNPNALNGANGAGATNPFRLDRPEANTADQDHDYTPEQQAFDNGAMDLFPLNTGAGGTATGSTPPAGAPVPYTTTGLVMGYYDGNTVTAYWNYAQHFAMSDNAYDTNFGPSTPGAINLISGQTNGVVQTLNGTGDEIDDGHGGLTLISDADPIGDVCSKSTGAQARMGSKNIGDLLNSAGVTWGFFSGGFDLTQNNANGTTGCGRSSVSTVTGVTKLDYIPHHQPFQYYPSTANPLHARPSSVHLIGTSNDGANHQYDVNDFYAAVEAHNLPAVSFIKAIGIQDGHAGYSDPLDEQNFVTHVINLLEGTPEWSSTAVVIAYDDSDGWYDHVQSPIVNPSSTAADALNGAGVCNHGAGTTPATALPGIAGQPAQGRCGYGPRLPLLVISPYARLNYVDHTVTDQSSILRFVEDNWVKGTRIGQGSFDSIAGSLDGLFNFKGPHRVPRKLFLNESTGEPLN